jgi:hypothetical protein
MKQRNYFAVDEESGRKTYYCKLCEKNFNNLKEIMNHIQEHHLPFRSR